MKTALCTAFFPTLTAVILLGSNRLCLAQYCEILSVDTNGALTFYVDQTNLYCGLQYRFGFEADTEWANDTEPPLWNFTNISYTSTVYLPSNAFSYPQAFVRVVCSTNPLPVPTIGNAYEVYGGDSYTTTEPEHWKKGYDPAAYGYTLLGAATNTASFAGAHNVYIVRVPPDNVAHIDAIKGSDGLYYSSFADGNTQFWWNVSGPPDGLCALVAIEHPDIGGFVVIDATGHNLQGINVYTCQ